MFQTAVLIYLKSTSMSLLFFSFILRSIQSCLTLSRRNPSRNDDCGSYSRLCKKTVHPDVKALLHHQCAQVARGHPDGDEIGHILDIIPRFLWQVSVTVAGQMKEQVIGVLPGSDDNPIENDIVDHDSFP